MSPGTHQVLGRAPVDELRAWNRGCITHSSGPTLRHEAGLARLQKIATQSSGRKAVRKPSSPYVRKGTDGRDPGVDVEALRRATWGVVENRPCTEVPTLRPPGRPQLLRWWLPEPPEPVRAE